MNEEEPNEISAESNEQEPTSQELAEACKDVLTAEDCQELAEMEFGDALNNSFTLLSETGIEDPEAFLKKKGILE